MTELITMTENVARNQSEFSQKHTAAGKCVKNHVTIINFSPNSLGRQNLHFDLSENTGKVTERARKHCKSQATPGQANQPNVTYAIRT